MPIKLIGQGNRPTDYSKWTIISFPDWRALEAFDKKADDMKPSSIVANANANFRSFVEANINSESYGLFGKNPKSYAEAMKRDKFIYYDEYKEIKERVEKIVREKLQKDKTAEVMKPKFVYNDKQIGEFVYDRASMSLKPKIYWYCPAENRVVDMINEITYLYCPSQKRVVDKNEKILRDGNIMVLEDAKRSIVVNAIKKDEKYLEILPSIRVRLKEGGEEYIPLKGEETLKEGRKKGLIDVTSTNKKVYLYKEKKPKQYKAVKIIISLTAGGFTNWTHDFYTGICAGIIVDVLESLDYSVEIVVAVGGGRCGGCWRKLNFNGVRTHGRRFILFTAKNFDEQMDSDGLLYTLCDPSFHNIKFISLLNSFFNYYGDEIDTSGSPAGTWHGIDALDLQYPIGAQQKAVDFKKNIGDVLYFSLNMIKNENEIVQYVSDLAIYCENKNLESLNLYKSNEFKFT
jgi:hypothetical protein